MKSIIACLMIAAIAFSCTKDNMASHTSYQGGIPFTSVVTPVTSVNLGDTIVSTVHCETETNGGSVDFLGFQLIENPAHNFKITAVAFYDLYGNVTSPKTWKFDKYFGLPTTEKGTYVLNFYNGDTIFQKDSVVVK